MRLKRVIGLLGVVAFAAMTPAASAVANGRLVYGTTMGAIYSVNPDGSGTTALHSGYSPAVSPDGTRLVFAERTPGDGDAVGIWVAGADGSNPVEIGKSVQPQAFAWSPDGRRIAFVSGDYVVGWSLIVIKSDGSGSSIVADDASPATPPSWSPDGNSLAYTTRDNVDIAVANVDGSGTTRLIRDATRDVAPAWSPDGSRIAFFRESWSRFVLYAMNTNGSGLQQLGNARAPDPSEGSLAPPAWSPSGSRIAFGGSEIAGWWRFPYYKHDVYTVRSDGADERRLTDSRAFDAGSRPFWSPDGRRLAFLSSRNGTSQVFDMNPDGSCETQMTTSAEAATAASWQPLALDAPAAELKCAALGIVGSIETDRTRPYLDDDRVYVYRGVISNAGNVTSGEITFKTAAQGPFFYLSASAPSASCHIGAEVECTLPPLAPAATVEVEVRFQAPTSGTQTLTAAATSSGPADGDASDNVDRQGRYFPFCEIAAQHGSTIRASSDDDLICGTVGPDKIFAGDGSDRVLAGPGHDVVHGGGARDWLFGNGGSDFLYGDSGDDRIHGENNDDVLVGGSGADLIWGDDGGDFIRGGPGADHIYAGYGNDAIDARDGVRDHIYCGGGTDRVQADLRDVVSDCETVVRRRAAA